MNFVEFAKPLYVPSAASPATATFLVDPSRLFEDRAPKADSSYQLLALVASLVDFMVLLREASYTVADKSGLIVADLEEAVMTPVLFFRRFTRAPDSSSEEV